MNKTLKIFIIIFFLCCFCSCEHTIDDLGKVIEIKEDSSCSENEFKYILTVDINDGIAKYIKVRTNTLYSVGDTIKFKKY